MMNEAEAWGGYWKQMGETGGCLPGAPAAVSGMLAAQWREFGEALHRGAQVLDLGCGTGAVLRELRSGNAALRLKGVDFAPLPPCEDDTLALLSRADMTALPIEDDSIDALTSQFGIEYAEPRKALAEAARVAREGAPLRFVIHHAESPILRQNNRRLAAMEACDASQVIARVRQSGPNADMIRKTLLGVARAFPEQSVVGEIGAALAATAELSGETQADDINRIDYGLRREITTLAALANAAKDAASIAAFADAMSPSFSCSAPELLEVENRGEPIAWLVTGKRSG